MHAIGGERSRGAGRLVGHNQREIRAPALLQPCLGRAKAEALGNEK